MLLENAKSGAPKKRRIFHWMVAAAFFVLVITGLIIFMPAFSSLAEGGWTRIIHRVAAASLAVMIVGYGVTNYRDALAWFKDAALWTAGATNNPDTWKRRHKLLITLGVILFAVTGFIQWFLKGSLPSDGFVISVLIHDIVFFGAIVVLFLHVYHEFDWWLWKKRHCANCPAPACSLVCPSNSMSTGDDGAIRRNNICNNCRLCMDACRKNFYYLKSKS